MQDLWVSTSIRYISNSDRIGLVEYREGFEQEGAGGNISAPAIEAILTAIRMILTNTEVIFFICWSASFVRKKSSVDCVFRVARTRGSTLTGQYRGTAFSKVGS
jgi:hypothetical protein